MKNHSTVLTVAILSLTLVSLRAQPPGMRGGMGMGGPPAGPSFDGGMAKIFGDNSSFSATLEMHTTDGTADGDMTMPGKMSFLDGKSRFEMDMTQVKSSKIKPQQAASMKQMGMGDMVTISSPEKKVTWIIYPGMQAYVENPVQDAAAAATPADYKMDETELGKETVDGHACVKKKVTVTGKDGKASESTVWSATDLKNFPVKIETAAGGTTTTMLFKDVKLEKPDAAQFEPPADFKKYDSMMSMIMSRMGGGRGMTMPGQ